jgi:FkbM family methyltransferase
MNLLRKLPIWGEKNWQAFFEKMHSVSLYGMNIGTGANLANNGEKHVLIRIKHKSLPENIVVFDVGANIGNYSKMVREIFGDNADIYAFEPSLKTFERLLQNTCNIKIKPYNFGLSNRNESCTLYTNKEASGLASVYQRNLEHFGVEMNKTETIEMKTIDNFCFANNIRKIHFLKMDVEGHELKVLDGAQRMMNEKRIEFIQFEFGGCNIDSKNIFPRFFL